MKIVWLLVSMLGSTPTAVHPELMFETESACLQHARIMYSAKTRRLYRLDCFQIYIVTEAPDAAHHSERSDPSGG